SFPYPPWRRRSTRTPGPGAKPRPCSPRSSAGQPAAPSPRKRSRGFMNIPTNILALVFVLSFLIVFHEGGHYLVAKLFRFPVEVFSLGFGKRLFGFKRKETDYRVSLIPLGGYVKVVGLGPDESDVVAGTSETAPVQPGTRLQRLLILFAGPGVN